MDDEGALVREDSDDELGDEDHPWDWIFDAESELEGEAEADNGTTPKSRRRRSSRPARKKRTIIGAKMGGFECRLGQVVLLKSPEAGKDWIGIITEFVEEDDDENEGEVLKSANIMWFAGPDEFLSTRNKRRTDALPNEQYLTADFNLNPSLRSMEGRPSCPSKLSSRNTPMEPLPRTRPSSTNTINALCVAEVSIKFKVDIQRNLSGRRYMMKTISSNLLVSLRTDSKLLESARRPTAR